LPPLLGITKMEMFFKSNRTEKAANRKEPVALIGS
jgi:hypothetical protein